MFHNYSVHFHFCDRKPVALVQILNVRQGYLYELHGGAFSSVCTGLNFYCQFSPGIFLGFLEVSFKITDSASSCAVLFFRFDIFTLITLRQMRVL